MQIDESNSYISEKLTQLRATHATHADYLVIQLIKIATTHNSMELKQLNATGSTLPNSYLCVPRGVLLIASILLGSTTSHPSYLIASAQPHSFNLLFWSQCSGGCVLL